MVTQLVFWGFVAAALFYLLTEHRAHVFGVLPFLILLACPLMHVFMHHGHGDHGSKESPAQDNSPSSKAHGAHHSS
jgi:hypothetical protein